MSDIEKRKLAHIDMALEHQTSAESRDSSFLYEPMLAAHPKNGTSEVKFLDKIFGAPIWISSMTGGTEKAKFINENLARVCLKYKLGMGLGSCRPLLESNHRFDDFNLRPIIGDRPMYANLGIAQVEQLLADDKINKIEEMIKSLEADGLIIHVNPLQELMQPEGDKIVNPPIDTIKLILDALKINIIVKEVGQGIGPNSLETLMKLPIQAIEFAAFGGTNFTSLELSRHNTNKFSNNAPLNELINIGHTADQMTDYVLDIKDKLGEGVLCNQFIISGGIKQTLTGVQLTRKLGEGSVFGQASRFLAYAEKSFDLLDEYVAEQIKLISIANSYLK